MSWPEWARLQRFCETKHISTGYWTRCWDTVPPCSLVQVDRRFRDAYCLHHKDPSPGGSTNIWNVGLSLQTARRNIPEGCGCLQDVQRPNVAVERLALLPRVRQSLGSQLDSVPGYPRERFWVSLSYFRQHSQLGHDRFLPHPRRGEIEFNLSSFSDYNSIHTSLIRPSIHSVE
jgi:hypothetical protein